jgi:hypothetical protein
MEKRLVLVVGVVLFALITGCAGPSQTPSTGAAPPDDVARLAGAWRGYFRQTTAGDTGYVHGDIELRIAEDGTYTGTWTTRQVAGSTRAARTDMAGTVVVNGSYVTLMDWRHLILKRTGDTLFGFTIDPGTGRTLSVMLERAP